MEGLVFVMNSQLHGPVLVMNCELDGLVLVSMVSWMDMFRGKIQYIDYNTKGMVRSCGLRLDSARTLTPFLQKKEAVSVAKKFLLMV